MSVRTSLGRVAIAAALLGGLSSAPASVARASPPPIKHVFIIVLENKGFDETFGASTGAPYLAETLPALGALVPGYFGVTHNSLGNYIALISGQGSNPETQADCQFFHDLAPGTIGADGQAMGSGCVYPSSVMTLADQLTAAHRTWKGYMGDMGTPCRHPASNSQDTTQSARAGDEYAARHNPFVYFHTIIDTPACAADDVPLTALPGDLASAAATPTLSFITPNLCDDGHDASCVGSNLPGGLAGIDRFLSNWVPRITASPAYRDGGLLAIIFDEGEGTNGSAACCNEPAFPNTPSAGGQNPGPGGGQTGAVFLSPYIDPGTIDTVPYNHFTLLRSLEDLWGLDHLGFAARPAETLGADLFTCNASTPIARRGRLAAGALVKSTARSQGLDRRPTLEVKLWFPGRLTVQVTGVKHFLARRTVAARCATVRIPLPRLHGSAVVTAKAFGGLERRRVRF